LTLAPSFLFFGRRYVFLFDPSRGKAMIIRLPAVRAKTSVSRSFIYAGIKAGTFPAPISLGPKAVGWLDVEISDWVASRIKASRPSAQ
jgi:prophage regulatory protein